VIKSNERKNTNPSDSQPCFEKSEHGQELGISFEKKDGTKRFALYSFLSAVDFDGSGTLVFRYTFGTFTIRGRALQAVWEALRQGALSRVCEGGAAPSDEVSINTIAAAIFTDAPLDEPRFPE
jgi:hypothetical protein